MVHLFADCEIIKKLWTDLGNECADFTFPNLTSKSAYFGFFELQDIFINHIYLIFKIAVIIKAMLDPAVLGILKTKSLLLEILKIISLF